MSSFHFLFSKLFLVVLGSLYFHINFRISFPISIETNLLGFDWDCIESISQFGGN